MPTPSTGQLYPPKSWDEFEEMCADLFMLEWNDPYAVRHGRGGQRQFGVDIYGQPKPDSYVGVQCKGRRNWPPTSLTTADIDAEVTEALQFEPPLAEFVIATTAPDDVAVQAHAREITERHIRKKLFKVHVLGWNELIRRLTLYPKLVEKHYDLSGIANLYEKLDQISGNTFELLSRQGQSSDRFVDKEILKQLERMTKRRYFRSSETASEASDLTARILSGELRGGSNYVRARALSWCARVLSLTDSERAEQINDSASQLARTDETETASAFIMAAKGEIEESLDHLAEIGSPESRSAAFIIIANHRGRDAAFDWMNEAQLAFSDLDPDGKFRFLAGCIDSKEWGLLLEKVETIDETEYERTPALFFIAAIGNLSQAIIAPELRQLVINQIPFEAREFPLASNSEALSFIRKARDFADQAAMSAMALGLRQDANIASDYALWLRLRDPVCETEAREELRTSLRDPEHSLRRVHLALQFGVRLDTEAVEGEIEKQNALRGGRSKDAAFARFSLAFIQQTPSEVAEYIHRYRQEISSHINTHALDAIEVKMLARAERFEEAEAHLRILREKGIDSTSLEELERILSEEKSNDPVNKLIQEFDANESILSLAILVDALADRNDQNRICQYGALLFDRTRALRDAERLATAFNATRRYTDLANLLRSYPEFIEVSDKLRAYWSWVLYREGTLNEANVQLKILREKRDEANDRNLEVSLLIASGRWDEIQRVADSEWWAMESRSANELLRTAQLAQQVGSTRTVDLVRAAVAKADGDPNVYLEAYAVSMTGGWEDMPEPTNWLNTAFELSDENGPIQRMTLRDVIERRPHWESQQAHVVAKLKHGQLPNILAARLLNGSLAEMYLMTALGNQRQSDPRKRMNIYAYSGARTKVALDGKTIGFEATALLTITMLGLIREVANAFDRIAIPHSTLEWLFEERARVRFHQPSRVKKAKEVRQLLDEGTLKRFASTTKSDPELVEQVGEELAALISEAEAGTEDSEQQRLVVVAYPVHRVGSLMEEEADLSVHHKYLCSCMGVLDKLKEKAQLTEKEEAAARVYLSQVGSRWPNEPTIQDGALLYLDEISVTHLQQLGLLRKLLDSGVTAYVSDVETNEVIELIRYEALADETNEKIEELRSTLYEGVRAGKVVVAPIGPVDYEEDTELRLHPTMGIVDLAPVADIVVVDDRCINQYANLSVGTNLVVPSATTYDVIDALHSLGKLDYSSVLDKRTRLRRIGYVLPVLERDELEAHLSRASVDSGVLLETAELKAIRENVLQIRLSGAIVLPQEVQWLRTLMRSTMGVLKSLWAEGIDDERARAQSNWLLQFLDFRGWSHAFTHDSSGGRNGYIGQIIVLLLQAADMTPGVKEGFQQWLDEDVLEPIKLEDPQLFSEIVHNAKNCIDRTVDLTVQEGSE